MKSKTPTKNRASTGNQPPETALALAVACGAANTQRFGAGVFDPSDVEALMRRVEVVASTRTDTGCQAARPSPPLHSPDQDL